MPDTGQFATGKDAGMSEKAEAPEGKKKGGKLPIIIALVAVLGGGGFFMMKKGSGGKKEKPKVEIGHDIAPIGEILVNLAGNGNNYARVNVGLQFVKGFDTHGLEAGKPAIRDAIIMVISSKQISQLNTVEGKQKLKVEIAEAVNHAMHAMHPPEKEEGKKGEESSEEGSETHGKSDGHAEADSHADGDAHGKDKPAKKRKNPDWDSDEGPVLKVHFADFVMQ